MEDLFEREQRIYDDAVRRIGEVRKSCPQELGTFETLAMEYGKLLKQLRRVTKISDKTVVDLNTSKLDLLDKVHYDALTGIYNRRFMEESLERIMKSISRSGGVLSVLMLDIDFFKKYNDCYGHSAGDECLKEVAEAISGSVTRADDFAARYGGEEFAVILPNTDGEGAQLIAEKLLEAVRSRKIPHEQNDASDYVTISVGAATGEVKYTQEYADYIKRADEALYKSKQNGRNQYTFMSLKEDAT